MISKEKLRQRITKSPGEPSNAVIMMAIHNLEWRLRQNHDMQLATRHEIRKLSAHLGVRE